MQFKFFRGAYVSGWRLWGLWVNRKYFVGYSRAASDREHSDWCAENHG